MLAEARTTSPIAGRKELNMAAKPMSVRDAAKSVSKRRQGRGWVVCVVDARARAIHESHEMDYGRACASVREWRERSMQGRD